MKRWAIYARYSSDRQNPKSCEDQIHDCEQRIEALGGVVVKRYSDEGISGAHESQRPEYLAMVTAMKIGKFDAIMAEDMDRLNRSLEASARLYSLATRDDVEIWTIADGQISQMHTGLKGLMGEMFLKQLADKTRRGQLGKARAGLIMSGLCYGYDVAGKGTRTVNEDQATIVRRIYREYASGISPREIALKLNTEKVATIRGGGMWRVSALVGNPKRLNGILNNPVYIGKPIFNRQRFVKDPETGKRMAKPNPPDQWIHQDTPHLRIVDDAIWERVKARREKLGTTHKSHRRRPKTLFSGMVRCEECGSPMALHTGVFRCINRSNGGTCGMSYGMRQDFLEGQIFGALENLLDDSEVINRFVGTFNSTVDKLVEEKARRAKAEARQALDLDRKIANVLAAIEGGAAAGSLLARLKELEGQRAQLSQSEAMPVQLPTIRPDTAKLMRKRVRELKGFSEEQTLMGAEAREVVRNMVRRITVGRPIQTSAEINFSVDASLGAILALVNRPAGLPTVGCGSQI